MTTAKELHADLDRLGETALAIKAERDKLKAQRDALLAAAKAFMSDPHADLCSYVNLDFVRAAIEEAEK